MKQVISPVARPYRLENRIQPYAWGGRGEAAFIPRLLGIDVVGEEPYAELWIGAHPKAPSLVLLDGGRMPLDRLIEWHPEVILGERVARRFGGQLPFLFKVLSAARPLSIQAHPNKPQARTLHQRDPGHYPDANHKPEIAIALDSLTALAGFKPFEDLFEVVERYSGIREFLGDDLTRRLSAERDSAEADREGAVQQLVTALIRRAVVNPDLLNQAIQRTVLQLQGSDRLREDEKLFIALRRKHRGPDVGLICVFLLNLVHLRAGEGLYIPAGMPHAYIHGNIIECMANSDNVVRVGLTEKFKDADAVLDILAYEPGPVNTIKGCQTQHGVVYPTPVAEFEVDRLFLHGGETYVLECVDGPQILLMLRGQVRIEWNNQNSTGVDCYCKGQSMLVPAVVDRVRLIAEQPAELYRVIVPAE